jgi:hypothetical protein
MASPARVTPAAASPMRGEVQSRTIPHLFHDLGQRKATGVLTFSGRTIKKQVFFQDGAAQFAVSGDRDDRFNQTLLKAGAIPLKEVMRALEVALSTRDRLGEVMVRLKMMSRADVEKWVKVQVREIIFSLFNRTSGRWAFEARPIGVESIALGTPADILVIEGIRRIASWARIYEEVGGLNAEYLTTARAPEIAARLPILPGDRQLLDMCRTPTSLVEMCDASDMGDLQVCRSIWGLLVVGALAKS